MLTHPIEEETGPMPLQKREKAKIAFSLFFLVCLLSQGTLDPTILNPVMPTLGVENWFGLAGSLLAGGFLDFWGKSSLLLPLALLFLRKQEPKGWTGDLFFYFLALCNLTLFLSLTLPLDLDSLQSQVGLFGMSARANLIGTILFWPALGISFAFLIRTGLAFRINTNLLGVALFQLKNTKGVATLVNQIFQPLLQQVMILFSPIIEIFFNFKSKPHKKKQPAANTTNTRQEELMQDALQAYQAKKDQL